jgi:hypothetical protein
MALLTATQASDVALFLDDLLAAAAGPMGFVGAGR